MKILFLVTLVAQTVLAQDDDAVVVFPISNLVANSTNNSIWKWNVTQVVDSPSLLALRASQIEGWPNAAPARGVRRNVTACREGCDTVYCIDAATLSPRCPPRGVPDAFLLTRAMNGGWMLIRANNGGKLAGNNLQSMLNEKRVKQCTDIDNNPLSYCVKWCADHHSSNLNNEGWWKSNHLLAMNSIYREIEISSCISKSNIKGRRRSCCREVCIARYNGIKRLADNSLLDDAAILKKCFGGYVGECATRTSPFCILTCRRQCDARFCDPAGNADNCSLKRKRLTAIRRQQHLVEDFLASISSLRKSPNNHFALTNYPPPSPKNSWEWNRASSVKRASKWDLYSWCTHRCQYTAREHNCPRYCLKLYCLEHKPQPSCPDWVLNHPNNKH